jgi:hypothetical protein
METVETKMETFYPKKNPKKYACDTCYFFTSNKKDFERHCETKKHKRGFFQQMETELPQKTPDDATCEFCKKKYKDRSGLWKHNKFCNKLSCHQISEKNIVVIEDDKEINSEIIPNEKQIILLTSLFQAQLKENQDFKEMMLEQNKTIVNLCKEKSIIMNNNCNNKTFNLQVFLNETCKDAMNIMDFANSLQLQLTDLEDVGTIGYIDGITNIIVKNLKALDISKRPLHCSDLKREILYVKDQDKWMKENEDKNKLRQAIKHIAHKNIQLLPEWKQQHPEYTRDEGKTNDQYLKIIMESMGGSDKKEDMIYENKIISKVAKMVTIDKDI